MGWIKRNLGFVISGALAVALLGTAGFFIYKGLARNSDASDKLNEIYNTLKTLAGQKPSPGNDKIDNTQIAKDQEKELRAWMAKAQPCFQAVPSIPASNISSKTYATALGSTSYQLTQEAKAANVTLPPQFFFSFDAQNNKLTMSAASLDPLAVQLGEVKAITEILFAARINGLVSIQRERVSDDDANGPQSDYLDQPPVTNDMAVITPYVVTFRSFSPELARVASGFASSQNPFIIKAINVQPASGVTATGAPGDPSPDAPAGYPGRYGMPMRGAFPMRGETGMMPGAMPGVMPGAEQPPVQPVPSKGGLQTVLKEQLVQIMQEVDIVKPLAKS